MTTEIYQRLAQFIQREEFLLSQLTQIKESKDDISTELGKELFILGAKEVLGRTGGKFVRKALTADEKRRIETQEAQIEYQHQKTGEGYCDRLCNRCQLASPLGHLGRFPAVVETIAG